MAVMKYLISYMFMLLSVLAAAQEYELVWQDHFRGRHLDETKWSKITRGQADWRNYMSPDESLCRQRGGKLRLKAVVNDGIVPSDTASFLTGGVYTKHKFTLTYGKVEIRVRLQGAKSVWPALWMLPQTGVWPEGGEIDIMERLDKDDFVYQTLHSTYTQVLGFKKSPLSYVRTPFDSDRYNVFGVEILPDRLVFSVNGKTTLTYPSLKSGEYQGKVQFPFGSPYYILMDMQIGGSWVGPADGRDLPVEMSVDWIKVYSLKQ